MCLFITCVTSPQLTTILRMCACTHARARAHTHTHFRQQWTRLVSNYQLDAQFLYSITIYMLRYNPRHVSSITGLIFRMSNCIITDSGIVTLEIGERSYINKMRSAILLKQ